MATINLSFPDSTYSAGNLPSIVTLKDDLTIIQNAVNALDNDNISASAAIAASKLSLIDIATNIRFNNTIGVSFEKAAGTADGSILEDASDNLIYNIGSTKKHSFTIGGSEQAFIDAYGLHPVPRVMSRMYLTSAQTNISASANVLVNFDAEEYDVSNNSNQTTHLFTAPVAGYYEIVGSILYAETVNNTLYRARILKNGSTTLDEGRDESNASTASANPTVSGIHLLAANDTIGLYAFQNGGTGVDINNGSFATFMQIRLIARTAY